MVQGTVVTITIAQASGEPMTLVPEVVAVAGKGLEGDRYFAAQPAALVTLIEAEAIDAMERENGYKLDYADARRNLVTRGVPLNDLVDKEFRVGTVAMRGVRLSEPCAHLASLTDERVLRGLVHRAGLKAQVLNDGVIRVGDAVTHS